MAAHNYTARTQEQQRLEAGMRREMKHGGIRTRTAHGHDHVTQLRQRGVGKNAFDVVLLDSNQTGQQRRDATHPGDDAQGRHAAQKRQGIGPGRGKIENEKYPAEHVHTRGHHRRGVDQGGYRGGTFHGVRQPDVQRHLRALAHGPEEEQDSGKRRHVSQQRGIGVQLLREFIELHGAGGGPDDHDAQDESKITDAVGEKRLLGGIGGGRLFVPETHQQITGDANQLPKDEGLNQVVRKHDAEHRKGEQAERSEVPRIVPILVHVLGAVEVHQGRDTRDDHQH